MKRIVFLILLALVVSLDSSLCLAEEEARVTGSAGLAVLSQYFFRGYKVGKDSIVLQPSIGVAYRGVSLSLWGGVLEISKPRENHMEDASRLGTRLNPDYIMAD